LRLGIFTRLHQPSFLRNAKSCSYSTSWLPFPSGTRIAQFSITMFSIVDVRGREVTSGRNILIVEDERLVSWSLTKALEKAGYCVSVAETRERAEEHLASRRFDLVITDVNLPSANGYEIASGLDPGIPVIVISAGPEPPGHAANPHVHTFVEKPFVLDEITALVGSLLPDGGG
jgi:CheY-like chemotaxis protein